MGMSEPAATCGCWQIMWTMEGNPRPLDPERFANVQALSTDGEVFHRVAECLRCQQRWMNATYPVASEGWHPVRG
jgi:hypothetical protein